MTSKSEGGAGAFLNLIRDEGSKRNPLQATIGTLVSIIPFKVKAYGLTLNNNQVYLSSMLNVNDLNVEDSVLVIPTSNDKFTIVCKIVNTLQGFGGE